MNAREFLDLQDAYQGVYQELDELWKGKHGQSEKEYQAGRSDAGKRISGDENTGPRYYTLGRARGAKPDAPTAPGARPVNTPKLSRDEKEYHQYNKSGAKRRSQYNKVGGSKGLPEEVENWINSLIEEGYDLSDYTWDEMAEIYLNESGWHRRNPDQIGSSNDPDVRMKKPSSSSSSSSNKKPTWTPLDDKKEYRRTMYNVYGKSGKEDALRRAKNTRDALRKQRADRRANGTQAESFDLFDYLLEYLVAEGYADTNENAIAIMANMSEEWKQSIVEKSDDTYLEPNFKKRKENNEKALKDMKDNPNYKEYLNMVRKKFD